MIVAQVTKEREVAVLDRRQSHLIRVQFRPHRHPFLPSHPRSLFPLPPYINQRTFVCPMRSPRPHYYIGRVAQNSISSQTHGRPAFPRPTCGALSGSDPPPTVELRASQSVPGIDVGLSERSEGPDCAGPTALFIPLVGGNQTCKAGSLRCRALYGNSRAWSSPNLRIPSRSRICLKRPLYRFIPVTVGVVPIRALKVRCHSITFFHPLPRITSKDPSRY